MACKYFKIFVLFFIISIAVLAEECDSLFALNSKSGLLYLGIDNPVYLEKKLLGDSTYFYTTNNGMLYKDNGFLNIIPVKKPDAYIYINKILKNDTVVVAQKRFFTSYVPEPCVIVNNLCLNEVSRLNREILIKYPHLKIHISDDILNAGSWIKIKRFSIGYKSGSIYQSFDAYGDVLSDEMIKAIKGLKPGQQLNIRVMVESEGNLIKYLPVVSLIVY